MKQFAFKSCEGCHFVIFYVSICIWYFLAGVFLLVHIFVCCFQCSTEISIR